MKEEIMKSLIEWLKLKLTKPNQAQDSTRPQAGVNQNSVMFLHHIKKLDLDYRTRQSQKIVTAHLDIIDTNGHQFRIHFFGNGPEHIKVETHDHNEK
jgi:hypothetical protein